MNKHTLISLTHILITGPLVIYAGHTKNINKWLGYLLIILGISVLLSWSYRTYNFGWNFIAIIHIFLLSWMLIYVGWFKNMSPRWIKQSLIVLGSGAIGYHLLKFL